MKKLISILSVCLITACSDIENCDTNDDQSTMIIRFLDKETNAAKEVGFAVRAGSLVLLDGMSTEAYTGLALPLDPNSNQTTFTFDSIGTSVNYELVMSHDVQVSIFDPDCDPSFTFINLDTVRQTFDSTVVVGTVTNRQLSSNVEIYL